MAEHEEGPSHAAVLLVGCIEQIATKNLVDWQHISELTENLHLDYVPYLNDLAITTSLWHDSYDCQTVPVNTLWIWEKNIYNTILTPLFELQSRSMHRKAYKEWSRWDRLHGCATQAAYTLELFRRVGRGLRSLEPGDYSKYRLRWLPDDPIQRHFYNQMLLESLEITAPSWVAEERPELSEEAFYKKFPRYPGFILDVPSETISLIRRFQSYSVQRSAVQAKDLKRSLKDIKSPTATQVQTTAREARKLLNQVQTTARAVQRSLNQVEKEEDAPQSRQFEVPVKTTTNTPNQARRAVPQRLCTPYNWVTQLFHGVRETETPALPNVDTTTGPQESFEKPPPRYSELVEEDNKGKAK